MIAPKPRVFGSPNGEWSVYAICPAIPRATSGYATDPKEARRNGSCLADGEGEGLARSEGANIS